MKYIFDFDDVIFETTRHRKEHMFPLIEKAGIPLVEIEAYYKIARENCFSLKKLLSYFSLGGDLYEKIMAKSKNFINEKVVEFIKKIGKDNCYIVTYGDREFNLEKIIQSGASDLFHNQNILVVSGSKKEVIEKLCNKHAEEKVIFIDDKIKFINDLDLEKCPNLKTLLYSGQNLEEILT